MPIRTSDLHNYLKVIYTVLNIPIKIIILKLF